MTILVDMDDTIEGLIHTWTGFLNKEYGVNITEKDLEEWDLRKVYPMLTEEQIYAPLFNEDMWKAVQPFPDAIHYLKKLISDGHDVVLVTASHYDSVGLKIKNMLFKHFPFIPIKNVIIASRKQLIMGDVMVDDLPDNLIGGTYKGILFEAPHNKGFDAEENGLQRAKNWSEVYGIINKLCN